MDQIAAFLKQIDDDHDGQLKVDDVLKVIFILEVAEISDLIICHSIPMQIFETIGKENINLNSRQIDELLDLISKEEYLENEEKIQKALEKSKDEIEQRQQEELQSKSADKVQDDEKHILDAEKVSNIEPTVSHTMKLRCQISID